MIRFAYFVAEGRASAASYHQAYIFAKLIRDYGIVFHFYPVLPGPGWDLWRRYAKRPDFLARIIRTILKLIIIPIWRLGEIIVAIGRGADGFIMGPFLITPSSNPWLEVLLGRLARRLHKPLVLYLSDAMHIPFPKQYAGRLAAATDMLCVTPWLCEEMRRLGHRTFLSRVAIDSKRYPIISHNDKKEIVLGFSGGPDNFPALLEVEGVLVEILKAHPQVHFVIVSNTAPAFIDPSLRFTLRPWLREDPQASSYENGVEEMLDFEIGIAPLLHSDYARGKDSAKLRQYMALGLAVVGTNFGVNAEIIENGVNGFLASNLAEWKKYLEFLIQDKSSRVRLGLAARRRVEGEFDVRIQVERLATELKKCVSDVNGHL